MKESLQLPMGVSEGEGVAMVEREREGEEGFGSGMKRREAFGLIK